MAQTRVKKIGKYEVTDVIGRGGMGVVYKAIDPAIGRTVAIKMITGAFADDPDLLKRFYREAQSTGSLQHPNIVTVYDLGDQEGVPYLVIEFLEGEGLDKVIANRRAMTMFDKLNLAIQVCNALHYAHQRTVVHRDIKPPNVMVLKDGSIKIVDFGIARIGNDNLTRPGQVVGSIHYMSPEQVNAGSVDARTDIWSTAVLLYELLAYALPFEGKDTGSTLLKILHEPPPSLGTYLKTYPADLDVILQRALAKDREERYQTAEDFALDLIRVQEQLKREMVSEYLEKAEALAKQGDWQKAREEISRVLRIDRRNSRAIELNRAVQDALQRMQRDEQVKHLQAEAEAAAAEHRFEEALQHLLEAINLDKTNPKLQNLKGTIEAAKERWERFQSAMRRAESLHNEGDLEAAKAASEEALAIDAEDAAAKTLHAAIAREYAERQKERQVQGLIEEARQQISARRYTAALDVLHQVEELSPAAPVVDELVSLANTGREQERRRKELDALAAVIEEALNADDYEKACAKADEALQRFPDDRGLQKLKKLAENQREAGLKRKYIEERMVAARKLLDSGNTAGALNTLQEALRRFPDDAGMKALMAIVTEAVAREELERKKADYLQRAKEALRRKAYPDAIQLLEKGRTELGGREFDDLLQFAHDEAAAAERRRKIDKAADHAQALIAQEQFEECVKFLETTLQELPDEDLRIIQVEAKRRIEDLNRKLREAVATGERLLRSERYQESIRHLESQPPAFAKHAAVQELLQKAREGYARFQALSAAKEAVREALSREDFTAATAALEACKEKLGESRDLGLLRGEIENRQRQSAKQAVEKAISDVRMLLLVRSYRAAMNILSSAAGPVQLCPADVKQQYEQLKQDCISGMERQKREADKRETLVAASESANTVFAGSEERVETTTEVQPAGPPTISSAATVAMPQAAAPAKEAAKAEAPPAAKPQAPAEAVKPAAKEARKEERAPAPAPAEPAQPAAAPQAPPTAPAGAAKQAAPAVKQPAAEPAKIVPPAAKPAPPAEAVKAAPAEPPRPAAAAAPPEAPKAPAAETAASKQESRRERDREREKKRKGDAGTSPVEPAAMPAMPPPVAAPAGPRPGTAASAMEKTMAVPPPGAAEAAKAGRGINKTWVLGGAAVVVIAIIAGVMTMQGPGSKEAPAPPSTSSSTANPAPAAPQPPATTATSSVPEKAPASTEPAASPAAQPPATAPKGKATIVIASALPNTQVKFDGKALGTVRREGRYSVEVSAGPHIIDLAKEGYQAKRIVRSFGPGDTVRLSGAEVQLGSAPAAAAAAQAPVPAPAVDEAQNEWNRISGSSDAGLFEQFARRYPNSAQAAEASRRAEQMRAEAARAAALSQRPAASLPAIPAPQPASPAPPPAAAPKQAETGSGDRQAILGAISRFAAAYEARNADEVARLRPNLSGGDLKKLRDTFKDAKAVRMSLRALGDPVINGDRARVTCARVLQYTFSGQSPKPVQDQVTIDLRRNNGSWVLESVQ